jgi:hypothetical protein
MRARSLVVLILVLAACGREGAPLVSPSPTPRPSPPSTPAPDESPTPEPTDSPTPSPTPTPTPTPTATDAPNCRNSSDPACGAFRFDPPAGDDEQIDVDVTYSPSDPKAGEEVTFDLQARDPDSQFISLGTYRFSRGGPGVVAEDPEGSCPRAFGPWAPPSDDNGSTSASLKHTYRQAGTYRALFTFFSHSYTDDDHPWPDRPPGDEKGRCIDPRSSSGQMEVVVNVSR